MKTNLFQEVNLIWKTISGDIEGEKLNFELEVPRKLLNIFNLGAYYYYIFNFLHTRFDYMSPLINDVLGYEIEEMDVPFLINKIHPEDQPYFLNFENKVCEFFKDLTLAQIPNYKVSYDYRIRKRNEEYIRVLQQVLSIEYDASGKLVRTLGIHTDISHIKSPDNKSVKPTLSFIGLEGEPSFYDVKVTELFKTSEIKITKREREILCCLLNGYRSTEIATQLYISKLTVDTHRKNLLRKMGVLNTPELIAKSIQQGLV